MGCGFSFNTGELFCTKNGNFLGVVMKKKIKNEKKNMIPTVSVQGTYFFVVIH